MKYLSCFLVLFFFLLEGSLWAQPAEMDYHECLHLHEVVVAPDGTMWNLPDIFRGSTFQRMDLSDTLWRNYNPEAYTDSGMVKITSAAGYQHFKIVFPDDTTILIIDSDLPFRDSTLTYYRSIDKGVTWQTHKVELIMARNPHSVFSRNGKIWMFLGQGYLYCSEDGGITFTNVPSPLVIPKTYYDATRLYMDSDGQHGVIVGAPVVLFTTDDGWKTAKKQKPPVAQGLLPDAEDYRIRVESLQCWNNHIFIEEGGKVFITEYSDSIIWRPFSAKSFFVDTARNELLIIVDGGLLLRTADLQHYDTIARLPENRWYRIFSIVNGRVYCRGNDHILVTSDAGIQEYGTYTENSIKISKYNRVKIRGQLYSKNWDILYCFDKARKQWYRVRTPFKEITDISAYGNETDTILLQDGYHAYRFCVRDASFTPYRVSNPLDGFLKYPVESVKIIAIEQGCFGGASHQIEYRRNGEKFVLGDSHKQDYSSCWDCDESDSQVTWASSFDRSFSAEELEAQLRDLNEHYDQGISWRQFDVAEADLDSMCSVLGSSEYISYSFRRDSAALQWLRDTILQISDSLLTDIVMSPPTGDCTTNSRLFIRLTNSRGKVQILECYDGQCSVGTTPYMLPLKIMQKEHVVYSSHVPFMQFIATLMPKDMITREKFTTHELLCKVARQLLK